MRCLNPLSSFEYFPHSSEESLFVKGGAHGLIGDVDDPVELVKLVKSLLHGIAGQVVDDAEVDLSLHDSVLRVKDNLLYHIPRRQLVHLIPDVITIGELLSLVFNEAES